MRGLVVLLSCCLVSSSSLLFLFVLVFGVVRAQLCEHARYPRTPLCCPFSLIVSSSLFFSPLFCVLGIAVCDSPCVGVFGGHDGDG